MVVLMGVPAVVEFEYGLDGVQLGEAITLLSAQINVANHRLLRMIAEFDVKAGWRRDGTVRSCAHWLAARCGMTMGAARERVRVARRLAGLPEIDQAFSEGYLSFSKVRAITRVATAENEGFMVNLAEKNSASQLEKLVGQYQPVEDPELEGLLPEAVVDSCPESEQAEPAVDEEARREQSRELYWFQDKDGMWVIHGRLPPESGHLVMKVLQAITRPLQEERQEKWQAKQKERMQTVARNIMRRSREAAADEGRCREGAGHRAAGDETVDSDAGSIPCSGGSDTLLLQTGSVESNREQGSAAGPVEVLPGHVAYDRADEKISAETFSQHMNQTRADALVSMVEHFLASGPDYRGLQGLKGSERCQVVLHVDVNTLREQRSGACCTHGRAHYEDKPWLSPATARRLSCDSSLVTVLEDENGQVLNVGRKSRVVPAHIRRALKERDGVCQYPGCHESEYVEAHHIQHWSEGGETSLDNLVTLCRFHHAQLHRGCFDVRLGGVSAEISAVGDSTAGV
jgi:Domain of unknown function (DUF222)/HNH endonuclease